MTQHNRFWKVLFVGYILILLKAVVFKLPLETMKSLVDTWDESVVEMGMKRANFVPFKTIDMYVRHWGWSGMRSFENLIGNVAAFVPLGMFLPGLWKKGRNLFLCMGSGLIFVLGIELFQLFSGFGAFDVDDILLNGVGILIGYVLWGVTVRFLGEKCNERCGK